MAKFIYDNAMDAELAYIRDNTGFICAGTAQPTTVAQATTVGTSCGTAAYGTTNWTIGIGDAGAGSRKITAGTVAIPVTNSATVTHIAFYNAGTIIACGTCAPTSVTSGGTLNVNAFDLVEIGIIS